MTSTGKGQGFSKEWSWLTARQCRPDGYFPVVICTWPTNPWVQGWQNDDSISTRLLPQIRVAAGWCVRNNETQSADYEWWVSQREIALGKNTLQVSFLICIRRRVEKPRKAWSRYEVLQLNFETRTSWRQVRSVTSWSGLDFHTGQFRTVTFVLVAGWDHVCGFQLLTASGYIRGRQMN